MRGVFILTLIACVFLIKSEQTKLNSTQANAVKEFFKKLLQVDDFAVEYGAKPKDEKKKMHKHMMELYQHYKDRNIQANAIIRSIEPIKTFPEILKNVLVFNISSVMPSEKIITSHLHVFRRRISDRMSEESLAWTPLPPCKIRLFQVHISHDKDDGRLNLKNLEEWNSAISRKKRHPKGTKKKSEAVTTKDMLAEFRKDGTDGVKLKSLDVIAVPQLSKGGWYSTEISMALKELLNTMTGPYDALLGVRFEGPRGKSIIPQRFLKAPKDSTSSSFIVISSEDQSPLNTDENFYRNMELDPGNAEILSGLLLDETKSYKNSMSTKNDFGKEQLLNVLKLPDSNNNDISNQIYDNKDMHLGYHFEPILKKNRHNHKTINALKISYDAATDTLVQKKLSDVSEKDKMNDPMIEYKQEPKFIMELSSDEEGIDWNSIRKKRSVDDNVEPIRRHKQSDHPIEFSQIHPPDIKVETINNANERPGEDDLGDTLYYEPDVFTHERLIPAKYLSNTERDKELSYAYEKEGLPIQEAFSYDTDSQKYSSEQKKYFRKNIWGDNKSDKSRSDNLIIKNDNPSLVKRRHRRKFIGEHYNFPDNTFNGNTHTKNKPSFKNNFYKRTSSKKRDSYINRNESEDIMKEKHMVNAKNEIYNYVTMNSHEAKPNLDDNNDYVLDFKKLIPDSNSKLKPRYKQLSHDGPEYWNNDRILKRIQQYNKKSNTFSSKFKDTINNPLDVDKTNIINQKNKDIKKKKYLQGKFGTNDLINVKQSKVTIENFESINGDRMSENITNDGSKHYKTANEDFKANDFSNQELTTEMQSPKRKPNNPRTFEKPPIPSLITDWKLWDNNDWETGSINLGDPCRKKNFQVSFAELGWGDWIIAPDNFSTNYCTGHCKLSHLVGKQCDLDSTNHAILQSLINAINRISGVPEPCCVPAKMSSKTVLYQDPHGNVMLRNYPNMVVNTCECR